jgi:predicted TIM-barrel fold metal-dependent hydrolase
VIQESVRSGTVTEETRRGFEAKALEILKAGAVGFGELTAEHLSFYGRHPYEAAPPDHPLFRLLADVAARHGVPIDLHMEAVPRDMFLPERFLSPPDPGVLRENIAAFGRLLAHNRQARIVWSHAGWDNTGHRTVELMRRLLAAHSNLYLSVKVAPSGVVGSRPLDASGTIRPEWLDLLRAFPERVVIGSDQFYGSLRVARVRPWSAGGARAFLDGLPPDLARRVGRDNALRIYGLGRARARPAGAGGVPDVHGPVRAWRLRRNR